MKTFNIEANHNNNRNLQSHKHLHLYHACITYFEIWVSVGMFIALSAASSILYNASTIIKTYCKKCWKKQDESTYFRWALGSNSFHALFIANYYRVITIICSLFLCIVTLLFFCSQLGLPKPEWDLVLFRRRVWQCRCHSRLSTYRPSSVDSSKTCLTFVLSLLLSPLLLCFNLQYVSNFQLFQWISLHCIEQVLNVFPENS